MSLPSSKRLWIALLCVFGLAVTTGCVSQYGLGGTTPTPSDEVTVEHTAAEILERANNASEYRTVRGRQVVTNTQNGSTRRAGVVKVWERAPGRMRVELYGAAESDRGSLRRIIVTDGTTLRRYAPLADEQRVRIRARDTTVLQVPYGSAVLSSRLFENTTVRVRGTETVLGRPAYVLVVNPTTDTGRQQWQTTVWIDKRRFYPLQYTTKWGSTGRRATVAFEAISFDVRVDASRFTLQDPGPGATVVGTHPGQFETLAAADFATPADLPRPATPAEYELAWARVFGEETIRDGETPDQPIVEARYRTEAGERLSITWSPTRSIPAGKKITSEAITATIVDDRHWTTAYRSCSDRTLVVGGSTASPGTLVDVAASVNC